MSQKKKQITIVLPDCMTNTPVRVVRGMDVVKLFWILPLWMNA